MDCCSGLADLGGDVAHFTRSTAGGSTGALTGFSGGISGGMSSSTAFARDLTSTDLGGLVANVSANEIGAATAGFDVTLKAGGGRTLFDVTEVAFPNGSDLASQGPSFDGDLLNRGASMNSFLAMTCLPAFTTFGPELCAAQGLPGDVARGDSAGECGVEVVDLGEVGEAEEVDIEERFLLPGTAFGAEPPWTPFASLPLGLVAPAAACCG